VAEVPAQVLRDIQERGDLAAMEELARSGDARAEARLAAMLEQRGHDTEAWVWWQRAAEHGSASALGEVVEQLDREGRSAEAVAWLRRGAEADGGFAQLWLAERLRTGDGIAAGPAEALRWYSAAGRHGHASAFGRRAELLAGSEGVPPDLVEAYASVMVAEIISDDSEPADERAVAVRESLEGALSAGQRKVAWVRAQELWPGLREAWWRSTVLGPCSWLR
jgi:TPR repeat protein